MALDVCAECGGQRATSAKACPHCGAKRPSSELEMLGAILLAVALAIVAGLAVYALLNAA